MYGEGVNSLGTGSIGANIWSTHRASATLSGIDLQGQGDNTAESTGYIQQRIRILQQFCHFFEGDYNYRLTIYRDRTAPAPLTSPTDSGAHSLALAPLLVPRTVSARGAHICSHRSPARATWIRWRVPN
jgi:hypothetical protein